MQKILIVDDDKLVCLQIQTLLEEWGYIAGFITMPEYLLPRLENEEFDLILMDINMPRMDGVTLLQQLKAGSSYQNIPVVMLTGESDEQLLAKCFQTGAADFVNKPIREVILQSRVKAALLRRKYIQEIQNSRDELERRVEERTVELKHLSEAFRLFVPTQFLQPILDQGSLKSGYFEAKSFSILFGDIRSYTTLAESMEAEETFAFLNEFFGVIEGAITQNGGFIDKFIGDAVMALFEGENSAQNAVQAAIEMQQAIDEYNETRIAQQLLPVQFGIGVNTGEVMIGALGSSTRLNSTVIGDHVNLASRLENLTKRFHARILISHHTFQDLPKERHLIRRIDNLRVRGKKNPVQIYEVFDCEPGPIQEKKMATRDRLKQGLDCYENQDFYQAITILKECLRDFSQDVVVLEYVKRCHFFQKFPPDEHWDGIVDMEMLILMQRREKRFTLDIERTESYPLHPPVIMYQEDEANAVAGVIQDISITGMKLKTNQKLQRGDIVNVEISFRQEGPDESFRQEPQKLLGHVMWVGPQYIFNQRPAWEIGLEIIFTNVREEEIFRMALKMLEAIK